MSNECEYKAELIVIRQEFKELEAELEAELEKHRWIPVSEGLPKKSRNKILAYYGKQGGVVMVISWDTIYKLLDRHFTHYLEIPALPGKEV